MPFPYPSTIVPTYKFAVKDDIVLSLGIYTANHYINGIIIRSNGDVLGQDKYFQPVILKAEHGFTYGNKL